ncbi:SCO family protein [Bacillus sp. RD4P76]|uniref:SCO family protein n=1 Tax=Bacillus suaedaesalsae TaxID=2810349 RepID=A0ABS2DLJ8_9BACI|nr:SCO family protein [Bacillus suaedaesalsae]
MLAFVTLLIVSACSGTNELQPPAGTKPIQDFTFTNQDGKPFGLKDLNGKVWMADFIFTNCETVCPPLTANLSKLQELAKENNLGVEFVSFSVDPEVDTPASMKAYGENFQADFSNWNYLTGYSQKEIEKFTLDNFQALVQKTDASDQVAHTTSFFLVNQEGKVVKSYRGLENTPYEEMIKDIKSLQ